MALPPLTTKSKPGLPPLKPRTITGEGVVTVVNGVRLEGKQTVNLKKGSKVRLTKPVNPSGVFTIASEVVDQTAGPIVLLEWQDPIDHPSCNARHVWARVADLEGV